MTYGAAARWRRASTATAETGRIEIPPDGQLQPGGIGEDKGVAQEVYSRDGKPILCSQDQRAESDDEPWLGGPGQRRQDSTCESCSQMRSCWSLKQPIPDPVTE